MRNLNVLSENSNITKQKSKLENEVRELIYKFYPALDKAIIRNALAIMTFDELMNMKNSIQEQMKGIK